MSKYTDEKYHSYSMQPGEWSQNFKSKYLK